MKLTNLLRFLITEDVHYDIQTFNIKDWGHQRCHNIF